MPGRGRVPSVEYRTPPTTASLTLSVTTVILSSACRQELAALAAAAFLVSYLFTDNEFPRTPKTLTAGRVERHAPTPHAPAAKRSDTKETTLEELKQRIHGKLVDKLDLTKVGELEGEILRREIRLVVEHLCDSEDTLLNRSEREQLVSEVLDETFGLGPLELLLKDTTISDILINGPKNIYCERRGKMEKTSVVFRDNDHLMQIIDRIISKVGRRVDETCPMVDARMLDGSRFNAIIPPLALDGACVSIRRFGSNPLEAGRPAELQGLHARDGHAPGRGDQGPA